MFTSQFCKIHVGAWRNSDIFQVSIPNQSTLVRKTESIEEIHNFWYRSLQQWILVTACNMKDDDEKRAKMSSLSLFFYLLYLSQLM